MTNDKGLPLLNPPTVTSYTGKLTREQATALERIVRDGTFELREVPYARFSGAKKDLNVTFYESGKLVVQGKGTREFVEFVLEPQVLGAARLGYEDVLQPELLYPRLGVDESGKGDFFGPLCIAGVYVNADIIAAWKDRGIRDSKNISSDAQVARLATGIRETPGCVHTVVAIGCEAYNRMHQANGSVNRVLAWGHARVIENLLEQRHRMVPAPVRAISDQFARDESTVSRALMSLGRTLELVQRHRAEEDIAVAAASILARDEFVQRLRKLEEQFGMPLPKGASAAVEAAGRAFVEKHGAAQLPKVAKMHFRTSYRVRGLPEPPKIEWKKQRG
ncbi:MAG: ribonuclease HIII [Verrucomicrobiae bacterium]|nr:ribonuclease HIII [Verrucomicrobiae bacterium]